jgi:hypothetical protein
MITLLDFALVRIISDDCVKLSVLCAAVINVIFDFLINY